MNKKKDLMLSWWMILHFYAFTLGYFIYSKHIEEYYILLILHNLSQYEMFYLYFLTKEKRLLKILIIKALYYSIVSILFSEIIKLL